LPPPIAAARLLETVTQPFASGAEFAPVISFVLPSSKVTKILT